MTLPLADGSEALIEAVDVEIISEDIPGWLVANQGNITVALDIQLTDALRNEGIARDIVNRVQNIRKSRGFEITDNIVVTFPPMAEIQPVIDQFGQYIAKQVLAQAILTADIAEGQPDVELLELDEFNIPVKVTRA